MGRTADEFDILIVGAGQAGNPLARSLAKAGRRVALVEPGPLGGSCVNVGCTPTKTMVASGRVAYLARRAAEFGVHVGDVSVRLGEVRRRKDDIVARFRAGNEEKIEAADGLTLVRGAAAFTSPHAVRVALNAGGTRDLSAPVVVINTGCRPARPTIDGLDAVPALDSTSVMELTTLPDHLVVLGGGYIGLEFGQMFRRFGGRVTLVHSGDHLLNREDADVADAVAGILRDDGIDVVLNAKVERVEGRAGDIRLTLAGGRPVAGSHLLVATGRAPNTDGLNLPAAGVAADDRGYITVDDKLETNVPSVYAVGDVTGGPAFTHVSHHDNQILRENLLHHAGRTTRGRLVPYTVFIDPQLGRVGLSEKEARDKGLSIRVAKLPATDVNRAVEMGESRGFLKAVVDAKTDRILGCAALCVEGGEVMAVIQAAMMGGVPYQRLRDDMFAHPTLARGLNGLFAKFED